MLRGLAFFSHAVGTAAFPGLVLAEGLGLAPPLGALAAALAFTAGSAALGRGGEQGRDSVVALVLVACLAGGVVLAGDVFATGTGVEALLFGSLLAVDAGDVWLAAAVAAVTLVASALLGRRWLAHGFDPAATPRRQARLLDAALLGLVALATTAAIAAVGALLVASLFVVPAATVRLFATRLVVWQAATALLVAVEGTLGLWLSVKTDAPPGATIACVAGAAFALAALARAAGPRLLRVAPAAAAALALLGAAGCGGGAGADDGRLPVVATTTHLADWARAVGGDGVAVVALLRPGTDPHGYEPRPSDVAALADAALVLKSGGDVDRWVGDLLADAGARAPVVDLGAVVPHREPGEAHAGHERDRDHEGEPDPHWWHDPRNAAAAVREIARRLAAADPARRALYRRNARAYLRRLRRLDAGIARCIAAVAPARRKLVTDHEALGAFARRYGLRIVGAVVPARAPAAQPSARDVRELIELIERERAPALFPEHGSRAGVAAAIARESGVALGRPLYGDSLGPPGSGAETYLTMEAANADAIVRGLTAGRRGCRPLR